jgi:hypothetical protein
MSIFLGSQVFLAWTYALSLAHVALSVTISILQQGLKKIIYGKLTKQI